jgi:hypothetical protein
MRPFDRPLSEAPHSIGASRRLTLWGMNKPPLPATFALQCVGNRWFTVAPSQRPHARILDRCLLTATFEIPSGPEPPKVSEDPVENAFLASLVR